MRFGTAWRSGKIPSKTSIYDIHCCSATSEHPVHLVMLIERISGGDFYPRTCYGRPRIPTEPLRAGGADRGKKLARSTLEPGAQLMWCCGHTPSLVLILRPTTRPCKPRPLEQIFLTRCSIGVDGRYLSEHYSSVFSSNGRQENQVDGEGAKYRYRSFIAYNIIGSFLIPPPPPKNRDTVDAVDVMATTSKPRGERRTLQYYGMYVCMVSTYSRVWINRVRLPILLVVS